MIILQLIPVYWRYSNEEIFLEAVSYMSNLELPADIESSGQGRGNSGVYFMEDL